MKTSILTAAVVAVSMISIPAFASAPVASSGSQFTAPSMGPGPGGNPRPTPNPTPSPRPGPRPNPGPGPHS